jgi:hypothetical protein
VCLIQSPILSCRCGLSRLVRPPSCLALKSQGERINATLSHAKPHVHGQDVDASLPDPDGTSAVPVAHTGATVHFVSHWLLGRYSAAPAALATGIFRTLASQHKSFSPKAPSKTKRPATRDALQCHGATGVRRLPAQGSLSKRSFNDRIFILMSSSSSAVPHIDSGSRQQKDALFTGLACTYRVYHAVQNREVDQSRPDVRRDAPSARRQSNVHCCLSTGG